MPPASTGSGNSVAVTAEHRAWIERVAHRNAVALLVRELGATVIGEVSA